MTGNTTTTNAPASTPIMNEPVVNTGLQATAFKNMSTQEFINAVGPIARRLQKNRCACLCYFGAGN